MNMPGGREFHGAPLTEVETLDLVRYWRAVNRNKWRILGLMAVVGLLAVMYAKSLPPVYRATATLMLEASKQKALSNEEVFTAVMGSSTRDYFQTQAEVLKSREFAQKVVKALALVRHPEFDPRQQPKPWYAQWSRSAPGPTPSDDEVEDQVIDAVMGRVSVQSVRNTQLVKVSFDSRIPDVAASVPNALATIFITSDLDAKTATSRRAFSFLTEQGEELKKKLVESENALQAFREREKIVETKASSLSGVGRQFDQLTISLLEARKKRADVEVLYNQVAAARQRGRAEPLDTLPAISGNPLVLRFKEAVAEAERRLADASKRYGPEHPKLIAAQADLKVAQENFQRQVASVVETVSKDYEVAKANEAAMERALAQAKQDVQGFNRKEFELSSLEREVASNRQQYDLFMQRAKEIRIGDMESPVARVIDHARTPKLPVGPNARLIVAMALLGALAAGVAFALLLERLDNTVKATHEVESKLGVKSIGIVQFIQGDGRVPVERMFQEEGQNSFSEAIRTIRSDVLLSGIDLPQKTLLLTSAVPNEGKTTVACNLAFALSEVTETLLLEADMRRPKLEHVFVEGKGRPGLSELVSGSAKLEQCLYRPSGSSLSVLQAGDIPPNPLELLSSKRFVETLKSLRERFAMIVVDSAPVQLVSDAIVLSQFASSVLLIVKADDTPYQVVRNSVTRLLRAGSPLLGAVLNQIDIEKADAYYGEYSGYGNAYYSKSPYFNGYTGKQAISAKSAAKAD